MGNSDSARSGPPSNSSNSSQRRNAQPPRPTAAGQPVIPSSSSSSSSSSRQQSSERPPLPASAGQPVLPSSNSSNVQRPRPTAAGQPVIPSNNSSRQQSNEQPPLPTAGQPVTPSDNINISSSSSSSQPTGQHSTTETLRRSLEDIIVIFSDETDVQWEKKRSQRSLELKFIQEALERKLKRMEGLSSSLGLLPLDKPDEPTVRRSSSFEWLPPDMSEVRVVLLGNSWSQRCSVGNFILGETKFDPEDEPAVYPRGRSAVLNEKRIVLINTPDLLFPSSDTTSLRRCLIECKTASDPGPHVFLLVLQPEDFTEEHYQNLNTFLQLFSYQPFDRSLVLISTPREESPGFMETYRQHPPLKEMIKKCQYRFLWQKDLELPELLTRFGQIVKENNGEHSENLPTEE